MDTLTPVGSKIAVALQEKPEYEKQERSAKDIVSHLPRTFVKAEVVGVGPDCKLCVDVGDTVIVACYADEKYMEHDGKQVKFVDEYDVQAVVGGPEKAKKKAHEYADGVMEMDSNPPKVKKGIRIELV